MVIGTAIKDRFVLIVIQALLQTQLRALVFAGIAMVLNKNENLWNDYE